MKWFKAQKTGDRSAKVVIDKIIASDWSPDWVVDFFGEKSARDFIDAVDALGDLDEITVEINSPGGDVYSGMRIHDYLLNHKATVHVVVSGLAASIASIIMLAGDTRTLRTGSKVMTHKPSTGLSGWFTADDLRAHADRVDEIESGLIEIYTSRTGKSEQEIRDLLASGDVYHNADQAVAWGFATHKDEKLQAVACVDEVVFQMQTETRAAYAQAKELESRAIKAEAEVTALKAMLAEPLTMEVVQTNPELMKAIEGLSEVNQQQAAAEAITTERARVTSIIQACEAASQPQLIAKLISNGTEAEAAKEYIFDVAAASGHSIHGIHSPDGGSSPATIDYAAIYSKLNQKQK